MKLDKAVVGEILLAVEAREEDPLRWTGLNLEGREALDVSCLVMLLHEAGLIVGQDLSADDRLEWLPKRLRRAMSFSTLCATATSGSCKDRGRKSRQCEPQPASVYPRSSLTRSTLFSRVNGIHAGPKLRSMSNRKTVKPCRQRENSHFRLSAETTG